MAKKAKSFERAMEDLGNIVELEHVNVTIPNQEVATLTKRLLDGWVIIKVSKMLQLLESVTIRVYCPAPRLLISSVVSPLLQVKV